MSTRKISRRNFREAGAASWLLAAADTKSSAWSSTIPESDRGLPFQGANYLWQWSADNDRFRISNAHGQGIAGAPLQPVVTVQKNGKWQAVTGKLENHKFQNNRAIYTYANANGSGRLSVAWRFEERAIWIEPVTYEASPDENVVSLNYFARGRGDMPVPALDIDDLVLPGICESASMSPIVDASASLNARTSLGRTGTDLYQQWALPSHYFAGFHNPVGGASVEIDADGKSALALCCGLSELPNSDLFVEQRAGRASLVFDYRGDLWGHMRGPGKFTLGAGLCLTFAPNYSGSFIGELYRGAADSSP